MKKKTGIRILSFLMTAILVSMFFGTAFANVAFNVPNSLAGHTMVAYQIFACHYNKDDATNTVSLSDVEWGAGINKTTFLSELNALHTGEFPADMEAAACAAKIAELAVNGPTSLARIIAAATAAKQSGVTLDSGVDATTNLSRGYYLILDETPDAILTANGYSRNSPALTYTNTDSNSFRVKTDVPTVEKKVKENSSKYNTDGGYGEGYNDVADYCIGDDVPFLLIGSVPYMGTYSSYYYKFSDTLSGGLTLNEGTIKVYVSSDKKLDSSDVELVDASNNPLYSLGISGQTFTIGFENLKTDALKDKGVAQGKYILVSYTAKLNSGAVIGLDGNPNEVTLTYSNEPQGTGKGTTPPDKVIVFTYQINATKIDGTSDPNAPTTLAGAVFELSRTVNDNGTQKTEYAVLTHADGTEDWKVAGWTGAKASGTSIVTPDSGKFNILGLDDGTYKLEELTAPNGFIPEDNSITFTVEADTENGQTWISGEAEDALTVDDDYENIQLELTIRNNPIGVLPETGGMGTTLFTLGGLVLMMAAAMLFVLRRRKEV